MSWLRHWDLRFDPFRPGAIPYAANPEHEESIARLVHAVQNGDRRVNLIAPEGLGKSAVLGEAVRRIRRPGRLLALVANPLDGPALLSGILAGFGDRIGAGSDLSVVRSRILDRLRLARAQGFQVVLAIDGDHLFDPGLLARELDRLEALGLQAGGSTSLILSGRSLESAGCGPRTIIGIGRLTMPMTDEYLGSKLRVAGRRRQVFSRRALLRLHAAAMGTPALVDRLAEQAMRAGAEDRVELVSEDLVPCGPAEHGDAWIGPAASS